MEIIKEAANKNIRAVRDLIEQGVNIDVQNKLGWTALMEAVYNNDIDMVHVLITAGANLNIRQYKRRRDALLIASSKGYLEIVEILLASNADINTEDISCNNALSLSPLNNLELIKKLIEAGATIDIRNKELMAVLYENKIMKPKLKLMKNLDLITHVE
jgi:hypothetical protein